MTVTDLEAMQERAADICTGLRATKPTPEQRALMNDLVRLAESLQHAWLDDHAEWLRREWNLMRAVQNLGKQLHAMKQAKE